MIAPIRTERRFGVTALPSPASVRNLFVLRQSETWPDVLDVLEQCCIEIETKLINTEAEDEAAVLANHKMSKAAWMIFTHMQEKIDLTVSSYLASVATQPVEPALSLEEMERENILNPTRYAEEAQEIADGYGPY
jgi:hypothetical protein